MTCWRQIPGWFEFARAYDALVAALPPTPTTFVEIGCWQGRSSAYLGQRIVRSGKPITLVCIDTFQGSLEHADILPPEGLETLFRDNLQYVAHRLKDRFRVVVGDSAAAASGFADASVEVVWVDGDHERAGVLRDIDAWWPKVVPNGVMGGDDWTFPGVMAAVTERFNGWARTDGKHWPWWWVRKTAEGKVGPI